MATLYGAAHIVEPSLAPRSNPFSTMISLLPTQFLTPKHLLRASIGVAIATIVLKTLAWYLTGSVGLLSDAMESFVNLASAIFALMMVTIAQRPADQGHPYGHNKAEYFSSGFEGILIVGVAFGIIWASISRLLEPQPLQELGWGLALSVLSSALNGLLAWVMFSVAKTHRSIALEADAKHLVTDVWTSVGVVVGLAGMVLTGWVWIDAVAAMGVALNILWEGGVLMWRSSQGLMDEAVEPKVLHEIQKTIASFESAEVHFDHVITRRFGQLCFVDLHIHMPTNWTLGHAAAVRTGLEQALMNAVPGLRSTIQMLPCDAHVDNPRD